MVLASDRQNDADVLAMNGAATACHVSSIPFAGPIASVRVGRVEGQLVAFPTVDQLEDSDIDLIVSGSEDAVAMIEGFGREIPEDEMVDAILFAHETIRQICELQGEFYEKCNVTKTPFEEDNDTSLLDQLTEKYYAEFKTAKQTEGKQARADAVSALKTLSLIHI